MIKKLMLILFVFAAVSLSCTQFSLSSPTPTAEPTKTSLPTKTPVPTKTPKPTATPDVIATQEMAAALADLEMIAEEAEITSTDGELFYLDDYFQELAKMNYFELGYTGFDENISNFVFWGDLAWESARPVGAPEYSGCGFAFSLVGGDYWRWYVVTDDNTILGWCSSSLGTCRTSDTRIRPDYPDSKQTVHLVMAVYEENAYVFLDGEALKPYKLDGLSTGQIAFTMISGTNADYGTRCEVSNAKLWVFE